MCVRVKCVYVRASALHERSVRSVCLYCFQSKNAVWGPEKLNKSRSLSLPAAFVWLILSQMATISSVQTVPKGNTIYSEYKWSSVWLCSAPISNCEWRELFYKKVEWKGLYSVHIYAYINTFRKTSTKVFPMIRAHHSNTPGGNTRSNCVFKP